MAIEDNKIHLSKLVNKVDAIYVYDDVEDVYYQIKICKIP